LWCAALPDAVAWINDRDVASLGLAGRSYAESVPWGACAVAVGRLTPGGALDRAGIKAGDVLFGRASAPLRLDCTFSSRSLVPGRAVSLEVRSGAATRSISVSPQSTSIPRVFLFSNATSFISSPIFLALGLLVAYRKPRGSAYRSLSAFFLGTASISWGSLVRTAVPVELIACAGALGYAFQNVAPVLFALRFPSTSRQGIGVRIAQRILPFLILLVIFQIPDVFLVALGRSSSHWRNLGLVVSLLANGCLAIALWDGWRSSGPEMRQRLQWIIAAFAALEIFYPLLFLGETANTVWYPVLRALGFCLVFRY
jgi:hypothetical protein